VRSSSCKVSSKEGPPVDGSVIELFRLISKWPVQCFDQTDLNDSNSSYTEVRGVISGCEINYIYGIVIVTKPRRLRLSESAADVSR
jgi:hypothetical protein